MMTDTNTQKGKIYTTALHFVVTQNVLQFWLDQGVDGFRMDAVAHLFEDKGLRDEPVKDKDSIDEYSQLDHKYTFNLPEVLDILQEFRILLDKNSENGTKYVDSLNCKSIFKEGGRFSSKKQLIPLIHNYIKILGREIKAVNLKMFYERLFCGL
jgi:hypothetical protein